VYCNFFQTKLAQVCEVIENTQENRFDTGKVTLNYAEISTPEAPLVLLHGGSARWQAFDSILPDLASSFHIYAPDFRGHGKSGRVPNSYRLRDYSADIVAFLQQCVNEPAFLFGHSLGGMIAMMVAADYPDGVRAVAVGDAPLSSQTWYEELHRSRDRLVAWRAISGGQVPLQELVENIKETPVEVSGQGVALRQMMGENSPVFEWLAIRLYYNDPDMLSALIDRFEETAAGYEMETILPAVECPVFLMQADPSAGGIMTDDEVTRALALLSQPGHIKLAGISHVFHNERKEPILEALEAFFDPLR
jgi:pimeloyl-ACP methyl ester carboxylesterase